MPRARRWVEGAFILALLAISIHAPRPKHGESRKDLPSVEPHGADLQVGGAGWRSVTIEPYKIAIGAFYAICMQRIFESTITEFNASPVPVSIHETFRLELGRKHVVLLCQLAAFIIWLGLYYINNVRIYLLVPDVKTLRRTLTHIILTIALAQFYFLGATVGEPGTVQVFLILTILLIDTLFPIVIGSVLSARIRQVWVGRGLAQSALIALILWRVPPADYGAIKWSAGMLGLMLVQLLILGPIESARQKKQYFKFQDHLPNG
jgi:hypothetical protein